MIELNDSVLHNALNSRLHLWDCHGEVGDGLFLYSTSLSRSLFPKFQCSRCMFYLDKRISKMSEEHPVFLGSFLESEIEYRFPAAFICYASRVNREQESLASLGFKTSGIVSASYSVDRIGIYMHRECSMRHNIVSSTFCYDGLKEIHTYSPDDMVNAAINEFRCVFQHMPSSMSRLDRLSILPCGIRELMIQNEIDL